MISSEAAEVLEEYFKLGLLQVQSLDFDLGLPQESVVQLDLLDVLLEEAEVQRLAGVVLAKEVIKRVEVLLDELLERSLPRPGESTAIPK
jgi:D-ribose pyranose/furanose isomerase RbsD